MQTILIGAPGEIGGLVRAEFDAKERHARIVYATSASELVRNTERFEPSLVILNADFATSVGAAAIERLTKLTPRPSIWIMHDAPPAWLAESRNVSILPQSVSALRNALTVHLDAPQAHHARRESTHPDTEELPSIHAVRNRLAGLVMSLRAMGAELEQSASNPPRVREISAEYGPRLRTIVAQLKTSTRQLDAAGFHGHGRD